MSTTHANPHIREMIDELPMRKDLAEMPLDKNAEIAEAQLIIRQAVPIPLHETLIKKLKGMLASIFDKS